MDRIDTAIVGGGAVGLAVARELLLRGEKELFVFEKGAYLADGQSGRNSGVIHAGIYHKKTSLKATLCVEGNPLLYDFCEKNGVACERTGKLIVATNDEEEKSLQTLFDRAKENGVPDIRMVDGREAKDFEPNLSVCAALYSPSTGIVDAAGYVKALARLVGDLGGVIVMPAKVVGISAKSDYFVIEIERPDKTREMIEAANLINSAGLFSDEIAEMVNPTWNRKLIPLRGEYFKFNRSRRKDIQMNGLNIYPAPEIVSAGGVDIMVVGIHLTPTFDLAPDGSAVIGNVVTVGPEFVPAQAREDYETGRLGVDKFFKKASRFFPNLQQDDLQLDFAGIMANLGSGEDWVIERDAKYPNCIQMVGIDSPALTSSLAIARYTAKI